MKIMRIFNVKNMYIQNFGSEKLFSAKINSYNRGTEQKEPVDIFITKLEASDTQRIEKDIDKWEQTDYGAELCDWLQKEKEKEKDTEMKNRDLFAIEVADKDGEKAIKAMAMTIDKPQEKEIVLDLLQTLSFPEEAEKLKGAGSCLIYAILNLAKQRGADTVSLNSATSAIPFYQKLGFDSDKLWHFLLQKEKIEDLGKTLKEKYGIEEI